MTLTPSLLYCTANIFYNMTKTLQIHNGFSVNSLDVMYLIAIFFAVSSRLFARAPLCKHLNVNSTIETGTHQDLAFEGTDIWYFDWFI